MPTSFCEVCGQEFTSRNKLFQHLRSTPCGPAAAAAKADRDANKASAKAAAAPAKVGAQATDWDGYLKHWKPSKRYISARQQTFARALADGLSYKLNPDWYPAKGR